MSVFGDFLVRMFPEAGITIITKHFILDVAAALDPPLVPAFGLSKEIYS